MTSAAKSSPPEVPSPPLNPLSVTSEQQKVIERIALQRERLRARRAARAQSLALAERTPGLGGAMDESIALRLAGFAREHPIAVAAIAAGALVAGPRRLVRWAGVVLPVVMRLRRKAL